MERFSKREIINRIVSLNDRFYPSEYLGKLKITDLESRVQYVFSTFSKVSRDNNGRIDCEYVYVSDPRFEVQFY